MRSLPLILLLALAAPAGLPGTALAQDSARVATLGEMRGTLAELRTELQRLRGELVASGAAGFQAAGGDAAIDRMNAMEARLMQLTDEAEQMQNRIGRITTDTERRLADLEFRLCEMDETCDLSALTVTADGSMQSPELAPSAPASSVTDLPETAATATEQADFNQARAALEAGDNLTAAEMFSAVAETHAGGPLTAEALYLRGVALDRAGDGRAAATAWLEGFSADPDGARAGESLLGIAGVIEQQGEATAACLYLSEIPARFPGSPAAAEAEARVTRLGCGSTDLGALDPLLDPSLDPEAAADLAEHQ
jgi:TolA-binding protein